MSHKGTPMFKQSPNTVHEPNCVNVCRAYSKKVLQPTLKITFWSVLSYIKQLKKFKNT